jgi:uncharacterized membrane protein YdjX (TVP38/TMEM64 family)
LLGLHRRRRQQLRRRAGVSGAAKGGGRGRRLALLLAALAAIAAFFIFDLDRYLGLDWLKDRQLALQAHAALHPWSSAAIYFGIYALATALSLPGATILTLAGGAVFGLWRGLLIVSFASSVGATLAFLAARFLLRDAVQRRFGERLGAIDRGIARDGAFYLFTLRLVPLFPFFLINLLMGLSAMPAATYYWVSQVGMLPGTAVYVLAGTELGQLTSARGLFSPGMLLAFALLGIFPLLARRALSAWNVCALAAAQALRCQHGGDRRRRGRAGIGLYRGGGEGEGGAGREAQDGRGLPVHRLRAVEGADPQRAAGRADPARR